MPFLQLGLAPALVRNTQTLGFTTLTPIQAAAIPAAMAGRDIVGTAQTGSGKTAAYLLPVLHKLVGRPRGKTGALVIAPTRELAEQIIGEFVKFAAGTPLRAALVIGGVSSFHQTRAMRAGVDLIVGTPGRLLDLMGQGAGDLSKLGVLVLDEADQMFDMGFLPTLKRIVAKLPAQRQTLLFSATMPAEVAELAKAVVTNPERVAVGPVGQAAAAVTQTVMPVPTHRKAALLRHLLGRWETPSVIVFTRTRHGARKLAKTLEQNGHRVAELHSDRSPTQRTRAMAEFRAKRVPILVATNIAARGLDVRHITHVVNFDVPDAPEDYVHRIGRTGRAGDAGDSMVFVAPEEHDRLARVERTLRKRLTRTRLDDFDYGAPAPKGEPVNVPDRRQPVGVGGPQKPYRGQGGRR